MSVFALQVLALAGLVALLVSALLPGALRLGARLGSAARADLHVLLGLAPALVGGAVLLALSLPSGLAALGLAADHCSEHAHGPHLCAIHGSTLVPALLALGAGVGLLLAGRAATLALRGWRARQTFRRLDRLSRPLRPGVRLVPTDLPLCHTMGAWAPRVLVSDRLDPAILPAALAHEEAHVARRDPLQLLLIELGALVLPAGLARQIREGFVSAADEVCDDAAAAHVGPLAVAEALLGVARAVPLQGALGLVCGGLERRVCRLLSGVAPPGRCRAPLLGAVALVLLGTGAILGAEPLHHAVEHLLHGHG